VTTAYVSAANTVTVVLFNGTGGANNPASGTLKAAVLRKNGNFIGSSVYDPPNLNSGDITTTTISIPSAQLGDFVYTSFSNDLQGITVSGYVSSAGVVTVVLFNGTAGAIDLASGNLSAMVYAQ
jgi:hypothetical protein